MWLLIIWFKTDLLQFSSPKIIEYQEKGEDIFLFVNNLTISIDNLENLHSIQNHHFCFNKINLQLLIQNSNFSKATIIISNFCSITFILKSKIIKNSININKIFQFKTVNLILFQNFSFFDLKCISNINMFEFSETPNLRILIFILSSSMKSLLHFFKM